MGASKVSIYLTANCLQFQKIMEGGGHLKNIFEKFLNKTLFITVHLEDRREDWKGVG